MPGDSSLSAAQVRFVEVSLGSPELDFYVNGTGAAYGIGFESFTSYLPINPGAVNLTVNRKGGGLALAGTQASVVGGHQYTAIVSRGLGNLQEHLYPDQETAAPAGQVAIRILNEIEGVGAVTVYVTASQGSINLSVPLASGAASAYLSVPAAGSYIVTATVNDRNLNLPVSSVTVKGTSGAVRTVVFGGTAQGAGHAGVVGFALTDVDPF